MSERDWYLLKWGSFRFCDSSVSVCSGAFHATMNCESTLFIKSEVRSSELEEVDDGLPFENLHDLDVPDEADDNFELYDHFQYTKSCSKLSMYFDD